MQVGDQTFSLQRSLPQIRSSQIGWFDAKNKRLCCLTYTWFRLDFKPLMTSLGC